MLRSAARFASFALTVSAASAQLPGYEVLLVAAGNDALPGEIRNFDEIRGGEDSGWVARALRPLGNGQFESVLVGAFSATDPLGVRVLRVQTRMAGLDQLDISDASMAAGKIAYLSRTTVGSSDVAAWLDDTPVAQLGMPAGNSGRNWSSIFSVQASTDGTVIVKGQTEGTSFSSIVVRMPGGEVLLESGAPVAGTGETIGRIFESDRAPDGSSLVAVVQLEPSGRRAILVDGEVHTFPSGQPAIAGANAEAALLQPDPLAEWRFFRDASITSAGEVIFRGGVSTATGDRSFAARNGRRIYETVDDLLGAADFERPRFVSEQGLIVWGAQVASIRFPRIAMERALMFAVGNGFGVDVDGDGSVDPNWRLTNQSFVGETIAFAGNGELYGLASLRSLLPNGPRFDVVARVMLVQGDSVHCSGSDNSTGAPAHLFSVGSDDVAFNTMELRAVGLPPSTISLPLFSLTPGTGVIPTGSVGTLCLGGAIGRGRFTLLISGVNGVAQNRVFLNVMPQPDGAVQVLPGETWFAQLWYRDTSPVGATSNFSDAISIKFR